MRGSCGARLERPALETLPARFQLADRSWYVRPLASGLEFRVLGPLEAYDGERAIHLGGAKQRSVLAMLLLDAGEVVSVDRLIDELWGDSPPADAQTALQQHFSRLRKALEPHAVLVTRAPGCALERVSDGLLGSFGFDRNGDISESPVTIVRVQRGGRGNLVQSLDGAPVVSVERPSPRLVAGDE